MEVFEPPFMCLSVKDRRYANAIEACFVGNQLKVLHRLSITSGKFAHPGFDTRPLSLNAKKIAILSIIISMMKMR